MPKTNANTRWIVLFTLTGLNILNYIDRNIFSALLPAIKADLGFSDTQLGLIGSAFIFSYTIISPFFGWLGDRGPRMKSMAAGIFVWSGATAVTGMTTSYFGQLATRVTVGLGEAAYSVMAPSVISDYFSKNSRGKIFAIYSCAIPVGSALGYVIGGILEPLVGWQKSFYVVGIPGLLLAFLLLKFKDPVRGAAERMSEEEAHASHGETPPAHLEREMTLLESYKNLFGNGGFMLTVLGYAAYTFVVGGLAFWMPAYILREYPGVTITQANTIFGGITVVGGFFGTLIGGILADRIERKSGNGFLKICVASMVLAAPLFVLTLQQPTFEKFCFALFPLNVALFLCISPLDAAVVAYVRPKLRATGVALNIFLIHALGDGISRVLMGVISDSHGLKAAISISPWVLMIAAVFWLLGMIGFWQAVQWPKGTLKISRLQAHRGYRPSPDVQENTLDAFRRARAAGAEMCECDVQISRDGKVIVFHDVDLKRIGNRNDLVKDLTADEIKRYAGAPLLSELLNDPACPPLVNIELKTSEARETSGLEKEVVRVVRESKAETRVMFSSFNPFSVRRLSKYAPEIPRALLVSEEKHPKNKIYLYKMWLGMLARPHLLHLDREMIDERKLDRYFDRGIPVAVWTVNDRVEAERLLSWGCRSVITDSLFASQSKT